MSLLGGYLAVGSDIDKRVGTDGSFHLHASCTGFDIHHHIKAFKIVTYNNSQRI